jgi:hypothetical protein
MFRPVTSDIIADSLILSAGLVLLDHVGGPASTEIAKMTRDLGVPILGDIEDVPNPLCGWPNSSII